MSVTRPVNLQVPFANTGTKNTIPVASQIGITAGAASFTDGFPPLTATPIAAGGVPPSVGDINGSLNILSQHTAFLNAGGVYRFDAALSTAIGGYPVSFVLQDDAGLNSYINILAANTTNFNSTPASIGVSWIFYAGTAPTGPTPTQFDNTTKLATTAFVKAAGLQFSTQVIVSVNATLTAANHAGKRTTVNANGVTVTLPLASATPTGATITIGASASATAGFTLVTQSGDAIEARGASFFVACGEQIILVSDGANTWLCASDSTNSGFNLRNASSLIASGYQKLPSGLIIQWGRYVTSASLMQSITLPIAFPAAKLWHAAVRSNGEAIPSTLLETGYDFTSPTTIPIVLSASTSGIGLVYFAIGN